MRIVIVATAAALLAGCTPPATSQPSDAGAASGAPAAASAPPVLPPAPGAVSPDAQAEARRVAGVLQVMSRDHLMCAEGGAAVQTALAELASGRGTPTSVSTRTSALAGLCRVAARDLNALTMGERVPSLRAMLTECAAADTQMAGAYSRIGEDVLMRRRDAGAVRAQLAEGAAQMERCNAAMRASQQDTVSRLR